MRRTVLLCALGALCVGLLTGCPAKPVATPVETVTEPTPAAPPPPPGPNGQSLPKVMADDWKDGKK